MPRDWNSTPESKVIWWLHPVMLKPAMPSHGELLGPLTQREGRIGSEGRGI